MGHISLTKVKKHGLNFDYCQKYFMDFRVNHRFLVLLKFLSKLFRKDFKMSEYLQWIIMQCFYYRVFPALVTTFPCFGYIFSLFNLQVFLCFTKISDLQGFPCIGYNFFMFQLQGFPCFNNIFFLFWLYYFPVLWTSFPCFIYRVFPVFPKFYVVVFQRAGKSLL